MEPVRELRFLLGLESMMTTAQDLKTAADSLGESSKATELTGAAAKACDEGRAMAMQGHSDRSCPYLRDAERELFEAWQRGFHSYNTESR